MLFIYVSFCFFHNGLVEIFAKIIMNFECSKCNKKYRLRKYLKRHIRSFHENERKRYICKVCGNEFTLQTNLNHHMQQVHEKVKYDCLFCDYKASTKAARDIHVDSIHKGILLKCSECDYKASFPSNLTRHLKSKHKGIKYECTICHKELSSSSHLKRHVDQVHNSKKVSCNECDISFASEETFKNHLKSRKHQVKKVHSNDQVKNFVAFISALKEENMTWINLILSKYLSPLMKYIPESDGDWSSQVAALSEAVVWSHLLLSLSNTARSQVHSLRQCSSPRPQTFKHSSQL